MCPDQQGRRVLTPLFSSSPSWSESAVVTVNGVPKTNRRDQYVHLQTSTDANGSRDRCVVDRDVGQNNPGTSPFEHPAEFRGLGLWTLDLGGQFGQPKSLPKQSTNHRPSTNYESQNSGVCNECPLFTASIATIKEMYTSLQMLWTYK